FARSVEVRRIGRVQDAISFDHRVASLNESIRRGQAEKIKRAEMQSLPRILSLGDLSSRGAIQECGPEITHLRLDRLQEIAKVPHRRDVDLAVAMLFEFIPAFGAKGRILQR